jgi:hypothetical protein
MVKLERHPAGPRLWIAGQRIHHGAVGCLLAAALRRHRRLVVLAGVLIVDDWHDWRRWFAPGSQRGVDNELSTL